MYYQEEAAVPLIVSFKGVTPAGRIDREHLVSALDVLPTICDYAGVRGPAIMRGQSLRPVIEDPQQPGHEYVVSEMAHGQARSFMVRTKRYKYMTFPERGGQRSELFFDLQTDPGEMKNLAAQSGLATEIERHRTLLADWNKLTEEASHPVQPAPQAQAGKGQKNKAKGKGQGKKAKQKQE
jgi:choline-sulfatase